MSKKLSTVGRRALLFVAFTSLITLVVAILAYFPREEPGSMSGSSIKGPPKMRPALPLPPPPAPYSTKVVDRVLRELDWGVIAFNTPSMMRYQRPTVVELLLSSTLPAEDLQARLKEKAGSEAARIRIGNRMEATLAGSGFEIEETTPSLQAVGGSQLTQWKWEVTPTEHGTRTLYLALSAVIVVSGQATPVVVRTFEKTITVEIPVHQRVAGFVQSNWQWLWTAILLPVAAYIWRRWRKARDDRNATSV